MLANLLRTINKCIIFSFIQQWFDLTPQSKRNIRIVTLSLASVGALFNIFVIVAIVFDPLEILHKGPWVTILNLAIADLISCMSIFCQRAWKYLMVEMNETYITIVEFTLMLGISASFLMLTFLTVQIFVITKYPIKGRHWLTTLKIVLISVVVWLLASLLGLSNIAWIHFNWKVSLKIYIAQIVILSPLTVVQGIFSIKTAVEVKRSGRRSTGSAHSNVHSKIAVTVIILALIFFFTVFPYFLFKQLGFLARLGYFGGNNYAGRILFYLSRCYEPIITLNFCANPILYSLRLVDYRKSLLAFIEKIRRKSARRADV